MHFPVVKKGENTAVIIARITSTTHIIGVCERSGTHHLKFRRKEKTAAYYNNHNYMNQTVARSCDAASLTAVDCYVPFVAKSEQERNMVVISKDCGYCMHTSLGYVENSETHRLRQEEGKKPKKY